MEYVLTGLVVAAAFAVIAYQQPVVYETLFPWLATSSALLIFALLFTQLSAYVDPTKLPDMFLAFASWPSIWRRRKYDDLVRAGSPH